MIANGGVVTGTIVTIATTIAELAIFIRPLVAHALKNSRDSQYTQTAIWIPAKAEMIRAMTKPTSLLTFRNTLIEVPGGSGDCFVCIPDEVMERMNWSIGDTVEVQPHLNGRVSISKCLESETTVDVEVVARILEIFGTPEKADSWLNKQHLILGMSPAEYLKAGGSKKDILRMLDAIAYGGPV